MPARKTAAKKPRVPRPKGRVDSLRKAFASFMAAEPLTLAASIAFYSALSFAPTVVLCLALAAAFWPDSQQGLLTQLGIVLGPQVRDAAALVIESRAARGVEFGSEGFFSIGALILAATTAFAQLQEAMHRIWGIKPKRGGAMWAWVRRRLLSLGIVAIVGFFLIVSLAMSALLALMLVREGWAWAVFNEVVTLLVFTAAFTALFKMVPSEREPWRATILGSFATAVLFEGGKWALGAYLANSGSAEGYGAAAGIVLLLLWVYYSSMIVLVGAAITRWIAGEKLIEPDKPSATKK